MRPVLLLWLAWLLLPPLRLCGQEMKDEAVDTAWIEILSPGPDSSVPGDQPLEISLLTEESLELSYRLYLDSVEITADCQMAPGYIFYLSAAPWPQGSHRLKVMGIWNGDTLLSRDWSFTIVPPQEPWSGIEKEALPALNDSLWEAAISLGGQYASCSRDTAGLGLIYHLGLLPAGEINLYGPFLGGSLNGNLNYDPSYDRLPHGLMQFSGRHWEISLGEFLPEISQLAFSQSLPLGIYGRRHHGRTLLDLAACRTVSSDTMVKTFAQYLLGGRFGISFSQFSFGLGGLGGFDHPGSLPDSVRLQTTTTVYTDTIFGLSDTLVTADTLHPLRNSTLWLWSQGKWRHFDFSLELARSLTVSDTGKDLWGNGLFISCGSQKLGLPFLLSYSYTAVGFRSFGNPFLETGKGQLTAKMDWEGLPGLGLTAELSLYRLWSDASPATGYGITLGLSHRPKNNFEKVLRLQIGHRPYKGYNYELRSLSAMISGSALGFRASLNYSFSQSAATRTSRTHNLGLDLSPKFFSRLLSPTLNCLYSHAQSLEDGSSQERYNLGCLFSGDISPHLFYNFQARMIMSLNSSDNLPSYQQTVWQLKAGYRF